MDVAYTHNSTTDDYVYDIWFKASFVLSEWVIPVTGFVGGGIRGDRGPREAEMEKWNLIMGARLYTEKV